MWNIYLAPLERLAAKPASWAAQTLGLGHHYVPSVARTTYVLENSFEGNSLTNDAEMYDHWVKLAKNLVLSQILAIVELIVVVGHSYPARAANCLNGH